MRRLHRPEWQEIERSCYFLPWRQHAAAVSFAAPTLVRLRSLMSPTRLPHIGLFDSGIGGLSVLRALRQSLPTAQVTYIADTHYTPWGDRPTPWVIERSLCLGAWLIDNGADLVLIACNTATTQAIKALRARWPGQRFVGVEPGIKPAVARSRNGRVAVMGTSATLASARFVALVDAHAADTRLLRLPCPGLVELIEQGCAVDPSVAEAADTALKASLDRIAEAVLAAGVDTVVLACTHYPLVADALAQRLGAGVALVDTAEAVARQVASLLGDADRAPALPRLAAPLPRLLSTGDPAPLLRAAQRWIDAAAQVERLALPEACLQP